MNINIQKMFLIIAFFIFVISAVFIRLTQDLHTNLTLLESIEKNKLAMITKADELRHTSDDLTKYARLYTQTKNKKYKENYFKIIAIKNGEAKRPLRYEHIYWDLFEPTRSELHPLQEKYALKNAMTHLPYSKYEQKKLDLAEKNSNLLVGLEVQAFNALEGLFLDANGSYTVRGEPNQRLALDLLYSLDYLKAKEKIMIPIDFFLMFLDERNKQNVAGINEVVHYVFYKIFILMIFSTFSTGVIFFMLYKKLLRPLKLLTDEIKSFKQGSVVQDIQCYEDEMGILIKEFHLMHQKQDNNYKNMQSLALTDTLTQMNNKHSLLLLLDKEIRYAHRYTNPLSILMYDIDFFKKVNDTYGHDVGDKVLATLSTLAKDSLRGMDSIGRYGGEEFLILLPNTSLDNAKIFAQRFKDKVAHYTFETIDSLTISIGLVELQENETKDEVFKRVDTLLYVSKHNGRNCISS
ncbi:GGDEF domain-containing protein [Sulfurimonas sp. SAG-AH-194-I05]|nr:GGDEF domain-containing protein [Sulfurimonas sp. SAG-AH-194-I05]MDF1874741.1 GGDEF domain-containing protein [Sulfurimonas sp. SAG-AH-194-I05]